MEIEKGQSYRGPCGVLKDTNWLTAEALPTGKDAVVVVEDVILRRGVKFKSETKKVAGSLKFVGKDKELVLNSTNLSVMSRLFGADTGGWIGKSIALYTTEVSAFGGSVLAVRIRAKAPKQAARPTTEEAETASAPIAPFEPGSDIEPSEQRGG